VASVCSANFDAISHAHHPRIFTLDGSPRVKRAVVFSDRMGEVISFHCDCEA